MKQQKSLSDIRNQLNEAVEDIEAIQRRIMNEGKKLSFEQKVIRAAIAIESGDPVKDFLNDYEISEVIKIMADVYTITGVRMPEDS